MKLLPSSPDDQDQLYTVADVAARFKVSVRTVRRWITEKKLKAHKLGRPGAPKAGIRISESEIQRFLKEGPR